jgi:hypothetical protein
MRNPATDALLKKYIVSSESRPGRTGPAGGLDSWDVGECLVMPPPRGWLLGNIFCRGFVSSLLAGGGVGKTALRYTQLISAALGRSLTGEHVFQRCRVLILCLEDGTEELMRRIQAVLIHHGINQSDLTGWLFAKALGSADGKLMGMDEKGRLVRGALADTLNNEIVGRRLDLVCLDPFVKSHAVEENDNGAIDQVMQILTDLCTEHNISIDTPHHNSKGTADPGNADKGRGASSMTGAGRLFYTLAPMSTAEAKNFGIPERDRRLYIRMDAGKVNPCRATDAVWFRLVGVKLGNGTDLYPNGDEVQTVEPWTPPDTWAGLNNHLLNRILDDIDAGLDGTPYSGAKQAGEARGAWTVVTRHAPDKSPGQAKEIIKTWIANGVLVETDYVDKWRKSAKGVRSDPAKRPTI